MCMCIRGSVCMCMQCVYVCVCVCSDLLSLFVPRLLHLWRLCEVCLAVSKVMVPAALNPLPHPFQPVPVGQHRLG